MKISTRLKPLITLLRLTGSWIVRHKMLTFLILLAFLFVIEYFSLPSASELSGLRKANPKKTALMVQREKESAEMGRKFILYHKWVPLSQISENLKRAIIVAEDGTFYQHEGIDWYEVREAIRKDIQRGKFARGASTITQQVAKNLFLSTSKDPVRKLKEAIVAVMLEKELSKSRILEIYLNIIEWGHGIFGVEAASQKYFGKHASELTREDAARLAAVIPSPLRHDPTVDSRYLRYRKNIILVRMSNRGW